MSRHLEMICGNKVRLSFLLDILHAKGKAKIFFLYKEDCQNFQLYMVYGRKGMTVVH